MRRHHKKRHFLSHTLEHVLWVFFIFLVAVSIGTTVKKLEPWSPVQITETFLSDGAAVPNTPSQTENVAEGDRPLLKVFIDNEAVTDFTLPITAPELELRVTTPPAEGVTFMGMNDAGNLVLLGEGVQDDLLSRQNTDVWIYTWNTMELAPENVRLYARVKEATGSAETTPTLGLVIAKKDKDVLESAPLLASGGEKKITRTPSLKETEQVTERVSDPSSCANEEECKIYCNNDSARGERCLQFARTQIEEMVVSRPSLLDNIPDERAWQLIADPNKRPKDLPESVDTPTKLREYCAQTVHFVFCVQALVKNDMASPSMLEEKGKEVTLREEKSRQIFRERNGVRRFIDSDHDGVTDYDEINIFHTDMTSVDTDGDGFPDGAEILARTNPRGGMRAVVTNDVTSFSLNTTNGTSTNLVDDESVIVDNPRIAGIVEKKTLVISDVTGIAREDDADTTVTRAGIKFSGYAPANSFVTLYIFSDPVAVTLKADQAGNWTYILHKDIPSGAHHAYAVASDENGHILIKSESYEFIKEGDRITRGGLPRNETTQSGPILDSSALALFAVLLGILGVLLSVIGWFLGYSGREKRVDVRRTRK